MADAPDLLAPLKLHYLRWVLFEEGGTYFMYQGIFDTDFDKYIEDAVALFASTGIITVFTNFEGFPENWQGNVPAIGKFFQRTSMPLLNLEYAEYPYATADEVKKALRVKSAMSTCSMTVAAWRAMLESEDIQHITCACPDYWAVDPTHALGHVRFGSLAGGQTVPEINPPLSALVR